MEKAENRIFYDEDVWRVKNELSGRIVFDDDEEDAEEKPDRQADEES